MEYGCMKPANPMALSFHLAHSWGYEYVLGVEFSKHGRSTSDMGFRIDAPAFRQDGAPKFETSPGFGDLVLWNGKSNMMIIQATTKTNMAARMKKIKREHGETARLWLADPNRHILVMGWETLPDSNGMHQARIATMTLENPCWNVDTIRFRSRDDHGNAQFFSESKTSAS